ncbi:di-trans,poly-cis-decaprenylcistransferase [bacterium]|nr:di-trans,poly-cis-decaprenylcistransferase [bacterium]
MDGNGRWARRHKLPRVAGHREGINSVRDIVEYAGQVGIGFLTLYTFSAENWHRPPREVSALMKLLVGTIHKEVQNLHRQQVRINTIGDFEALPPAARDSLQKAMEITRDNSGLVLTLALSYGSRQEILRAVSQFLAAPPPELDMTLFESRLDTAGMPDPDLLIRTGGEHRISNFLLWQLAYTGIVFFDVYWPDFRCEQLAGALEG